MPRPQNHPLAIRDQLHVRKGPNPDQPCQVTVDAISKFAQDYMDSSLSTYVWSEVTMTEKEKQKYPLQPCIKFVGEDFGDVIRGQVCPRRIQS